MKRNICRKNRIRKLSRALLSLCLAAVLAVPAAPCALAEGEHIHTDACYSVGNHLACGQEENPGHQHSEECWGLVRGDLLCLDITGEHMHDDSCYAWSEELLCGLKEGEGAHEHTEDCYEQERVLICGYEDADVSPLEEEPGSAVEESEPGLTEEGQEETAAEPEPEPAPAIGPGDGVVSLLQMERELSFAAESDPTADLEDETDWWRMFADMELSGNWAEDLLKVADSQIGYTESELNYVAEDPWHPKGYTRYGAWFGLPYGDWCAMFISFCLYYAEIPDSVIPYSCHCLEMVQMLTERGLYRHWDSGYVPKPGDLVFFDFDLDEKAEHVGIVRGVDLDRGWITTIEGNRYDYVEEFVLTMDDYSIIGYCELPENPNFDPANPGIVRQNGEVELPPEPEAPKPPSWDNVLAAADGIKTVSISPTIEVSRVTY